MKEKFLSFTLNFLCKYNKYSDAEIKKLRYGLEGLYLTLTKIIIILFTAFLLGIFNEVLIGLFLFNIIRYFAFGFHAEKSVECLILSLLNFVLIPYVFFKISFSSTIYLIICGICMVLILLFAPADTIKRPLKNKKKRLMRKIFATIIATIYTLLSWYFRNCFLSDLLVSSLISTVVVINPLTYWAFKQPYNNYKKIN